MATDLAKLAIRVESLEAKQAAGDLDRMTRAGKRAEKSTNTLSKAAKGLVGVLGGLFVARAVANAFRDASNAARKFEDSVSELSAITGLTGQKLGQIRKAAAEFGRTTTLSATQAAEAFKLVASTQPQLLKLPDQLTKVTKAAIVLAEATGSTLPDAADTVGQSLNQFGLAAAEADRVINVLAAGAQQGASMVNETAEALKYAGTVAATVGVSFETTNAAIQQLSTVGIKASEAGTALRNIFLKLEGQTETKFKPSIVGFEQALVNLKDANISVTEQTEIFGLRSVVAANNLINNAEAVGTLTGKLTDQQTAYEQQKTKVDNLEGSIKALRSAQEGLQIRIGDGTNPTLRTLTDTLTDATNAFTDFLGEVEDDEGFSKLDFVLKGLIKIVFRLGVEFTDLGDLIGSWAAQVATAFGAVGSVIGGASRYIFSFFEQMVINIQIAMARFVDLGDAIGAFAARTIALLKFDFDLADQIESARQETINATNAEIAALEDKSRAIAENRGQILQAAADEYKAADDRFNQIGEERRARREQLDEEIELFNSKVDFGTKANQVASDAIALSKEQGELTDAEIEKQKELEEFVKRQEQIASNQSQLDEVADPYLSDIEAAEKHAEQQLAILEKLGTDSQMLTEEQEQQRLKIIQRVNDELAQARQDAADKEREAQEKMHEENLKFQDQRQQAILELKLLAADSELEREQLAHEARLERMLERAEELGIAQGLIDKAKEQMEEKHQAKMTAIRDKAENKNLKFIKSIEDSKVKTALDGALKATQGVAQHSKTMFKINKALALANAVVTLPSAVVKAIENGGGLPWGAIPGAITLAAGLAQIAAIRSTTFEGGGGGTTPSLAGSTPTYNGQPVPGGGQNVGGQNDDLINPPTTTQGDGSENRTNVIVTGNVGFTPAIIDEIADGLREATGERDVVIFDENSRQAQDLVGTGNG